MRIYIARFESESYSWLTIGATEKEARANMERLAIHHTRAEGLVLWDWFTPEDVNVASVSTDSGLMDTREIDLTSGWEQ